MSKTVTQLTETTTIETNDVFHVVDVANDQDKKIKAANLWSKKPYGESYVVGNTTDTAIAVAGTYVEITNSAAWTTTAGELNKFTHDTANGELTYTGTEDIQVLVIATVSAAFSGGAGGKFISIQLQQNSVAIAKAIQSAKTGGSTASPKDFTSMTVHALLTLSQNDAVKLTIANEDDTTDLEVRDYQMAITTL